MMEHKLKLKFDDSFNGVLFATQGDTARVFEVEVYDELDRAIDPSQHKLSFFVAQKDEVTKVDASVENNKFIVRCVNTQFKYAGKAKAQFVLYNQKDEKLASQIFDLNIEESIENGATVGVNVLVDFEEFKKAKDLLEKQKEMLDEGKEVSNALEGNLGEARQINQELKLNTSSAKSLSLNLNESVKQASEQYSSLSTTIESATKANGGLKENTAKGNVTKSGLDKSIINANNSKSNLDSRISDGIEINKTLGNTNKDAKNTNTALGALNSDAKNNIIKATDINTKLKANAEEADGLNKELDKLNKDAKNTKASLDATNTQAKGSKANLDTSISGASELEAKLKEIISKGDLDKYVTDPKLNEKLKDYATKQEVENIDVTGQLKDYAKTSDVATAIAKIKTFKKQIVQNLPAEGEEDVIYLVKSSKAKTGNSYLEYLWINGAFELIGSTEVDLSGYAKTSEVDTKISNIKIPSKLSELTDDSTHRLVTDAQKGAWDSKVDKVEGKGLSSNDYSNEDKTIVNDTPRRFSHVYSTVEKGRKDLENKLTIVNDKIHNIKLPTKLSEMTDDSTHRLVTDEEKKRWSENNSEIEELSIIGLNFDNGVYNTVEYRKLDGELAYKSELVGEAPKYSKIKLSKYENSNIKSTKTWKLFYDSNNFIYKKELGRS